jgi:hypothetical protein
LKNLLQETTKRLEEEKLALIKDSQKKIEQEKQKARLE